MARMSSPSSTCPACGGSVQAGFRFCGLCGAPLGEPSEPRAPGAPPAAARPPTPTPDRGGPRAIALALVRTDGLPGAAFPLDDAEAICGRTEGAIRVADDATVSPRHARFTLRDGALVVEDLGSLNGTFLRLRAPRRLAVGAELRIGRQLLRLEARPPGREVRPGATPEPGGRFRLSQLLEGGGLGEVFPLFPGENPVGREAGRITFPSDRYVSARHARLDVKGEVVTVSDLGSSNGTFVRITASAELAPGDQLLVGAQLLRVEG